MKRRRFGNSLSSPILSLVKDSDLDSLIFIETSHNAALNTRAAALMFIGRHELSLTTKVVDDRIFVMKDRDWPGNTREIHLS